MPNVPDEPADPGKTPTSITLPNLGALHVLSITKS